MVRLLRDSVCANLKALAQSWSRATSTGDCAAVNAIIADLNALEITVEELREAKIGRAVCLSSLGNPALAKFHAPVQALRLRWREVFDNKSTLDRLVEGVAQFRHGLPNADPIHVAFALFRAGYQSVFELVGAESAQWDDSTDETRETIAALISAVSHQRTGSPTRAVCLLLGWTRGLSP